jgi:UPF0176 protein
MSEGEGEVGVLPVEGERQGELAFRVLLYYSYVRIDDPEAYAQQQRELCEELELLGRILVGVEGINGTVSGSIENTAKYREAMAVDERTRDMPFKIDAWDGHVFPKLSVKVRDEIVSLGLLTENDVDPNEQTGRRLSPAQFYRAMQDDNAVVIDGRNNYESALGHFTGALCPQVDNFRDFPGWIEKNREMLKGRKILTYCTGGIRCEKLSALLLREGFEDVSQLEGGIVEYGRDAEVQGRDFEGECYVFDQRVVVPVNRTDSAKVVSCCERCGEPSVRYRNCGFAPCNRQFFLCESCEASEGDWFCSGGCRDGVGQA